LPPKQRRLIKGIIINKFRGDLRLFEEGKQMLEKITGKPVLGIIPYFNNIDIEQEDSVALDRKKHHACKGKINVAVVLLNHLSNFTDFGLLEMHPEVQLYYTDQSAELEKADIIILPGTKNTIDDMVRLHENGLASTIIKLHQQGKALYGICGGYQIMGKSIEDPDGIEGTQASIEGLGLLPVSTLITPQKTTLQQQFRFLNGNLYSNKGYEIHMGLTTGSENKPLCHFSNGETEGCFMGPKLFGTYLHGLFDNKEPVHYILSQVRSKLSPIPDYLAYKEEQYNKLAQHVRSHIDMDFIYKTLKL